MYACYVIHFKFSWEKEDVPLRDNDAALLLFVNNRCAGEELKTDA